MNRTVLIAGLGLIGGSLAKALKRHPDVRILGVDTDRLTAEKAFKMGVIDEAADSLEKAAPEADFIFFATPVNATLKLLKEAAGWNLKSGAVLSDTGSTKGKIMEAANAIAIPFIGGHPMAGSHKSGVEAAKEMLFENAYYILTPSEQADEQQLNRLQELLSVTKAKLLTVSAEEHDHMTALVSHFPHLVAASLVHQLDKETKFPLARQLAAGGFRDTTRIASSNPVMWRDITLHNSGMIANQLSLWMKEMEMLRQLLESGNPDAIQAYFADAKSARDELPAAGHGALYSVYDLYLDVPDHPGVISEVTGYLAEENISIVNLRILETREDLFGILVLSFQSPEDRSRAQESLKNRTSYDSYIS
ncbi:prephenate dehydrogenase [Planococcus lenghuensis]|uniref:Prephenate dehydrogenase n=1 Tax=Planococcus lenghuensis TaxID=2213202 RepID=A0A1Q2KZN4_9BACL|nr:prephenate dehydrogenase [Planococcus lenghuensis]AQQ53623.1 prephenate dehydrogenase [Planococcus lenghuensis]